MLMKRFKVTVFSIVLATSAFAQGVIDVHSHIITPEFISTLEKEAKIEGRSIAMVLAEKK